jgi:dTDP-4-dehydrorhamnose reductase
MRGSEDHEGRDWVPTVLFPGRLTNSGECSWFEFAQGAFDLAGVKVKMEPIYTSQTQRRARRPSYSALTTARLEELGLNPLRGWREALSAYLRAKGLAS